MNYTKHDAKAYARDHMTGIWAAALNPFNDDLSLDERGLRANIRHWIDDLESLNPLFENLEETQQAQRSNKAQFISQWMYQFDGHSSERLRSLFLET